MVERYRKGIVSFVRVQIIDVSNNNGSGQNIGLDGGWGSKFSIMCGSGVVGEIFVSNSFPIIVEPNGRWLCSLFIVCGL